MPFALRPLSFPRHHTPYVLYLLPAGFFAVWQIQCSHPPRKACPLSRNTRSLPAFSPAALSLLDNPTSRLSFPLSSLSPGAVLFCPLPTFFPPFGQSPFSPLPSHKKAAQAFSLARLFSICVSGCFTRPRLRRSRQTRRRASRPPRPWCRPWPRRKT